MFKTFVFVVLTFALTPTSANAESIRWETMANGSVRFWIFHKEKNTFFIDEFIKAPGSFQDRVNTSTFNDTTEAHQAFEGIRGGSNSIMPTTIQKINEPISELIGEVIWETKNQWNEEWEKKYKDWLEANANSTFLKQYNIATDCADVAFAYRWIFSRISGLPAADYLMGSNQIFTNESMRAIWRNLPKNSLWYRDQRFLAALNYVLNNTYTHSLMKDSYPVAIDAKFFIGGVFYLDLYDAESGHTQFLSSMIFEPTHPEPLRALASTIPKEVRDLEEYGFQGGYHLEKDKTAFLRFRWPVKTNNFWSLVTADKMPGYSLEQFEPAFMEGKKNVGEAAIYKVMPNWAPDYQQALKSKVALLIQRFTSRVKIVQDGFNYCSTNGGCTEGSAAWEIWSTPSRDESLENLVNSVTDIYWEPACGISCKSELNSKLSTLILTIDGHKVSLASAMQTWDNGDYSSNPNDPVSTRWGLNTK